MKRINLAEVAKVLKKCPAKGSVTLRQVGGPDSEEFIVPSFSGRPMEYKASTHHEGDDWFGKCSCSGFTKLKKNPEPIKPCVHVAYLLRERADSPIPDEPPTPPTDPDDKDEAGTTVIPPATVPDGVPTRSVWPSGLALINACPAAAWGDEDEIVVRSRGEPAVIGSCIHEIGRDIVEQKLTEVPNLDPYLVKYGLQDRKEDVFFPAMFLSQAWTGSHGAPGLAQFFPAPLCEQKLEHSILAMDPASGEWTRFRFATKLDVLALSAATMTELPTSAAIVDWKSGDKDKALDPMSQAWSMAFVVAAKHKTIKTVKVTFVWLRDRSTVTVEFSRDELRAEMLRFTQYKIFWDHKTYDKGPHCLYCTRLATCPGRMQLISSIASGLTQTADSPVSLVFDADGKLRPTDILARAIEQGRFMQKVLYAFFDEMAVQLFETGPLPVDGREGAWIGVKERAGRTQIDMAGAWPVLEKLLSEEQIRGLASCSKSALQKLIYAATEYGQKKAAMESLLGQLEEAGAVTHGKMSLSASILTDPSKAAKQLKEGDS